MIALAFSPFNVLATVGLILMLFSWCMKGGIGMLAILKLFVCGSLIMAWLGLSGSTIALIWVLVACMSVLCSIVYSK